MQYNYDKSQKDNSKTLICDTEDSMPSTERDLSDDAHWKIIQKNTFTRWVNVHLRNANQSINDLNIDFSDGLKLMTLVEVLSGHKFTNANKRTAFRTQKLENVTMVLRFLEEKEGLKIINIDSSDIVDCRLKLILGLIWALILHYSISLNVWEGEDAAPEVKQTPKQRMMTWIQGKIPGKPIKNLTTDWNDGKAIGALVDSCAPGLCPDWQGWKPANALENTKEAMDSAEQYLDVPQLIKPEEMIDPNVDEKAMMTYLSQFPNAKLKPGMEIPTKPNLNKVRVYGPGIESKDLLLNESTEFFIDTASRATLEITISDANGKSVDFKTEEIKGKNNCYKCVYVPSSKGIYTITIKYGEKQVPQSPFKVTITKSKGDLSKVKVYGPGVEKNGVMISTVTRFSISTEDSGPGEISCIILNQNGDKHAVVPKITKVSSTLYTVEYTAHEVGVYSINVFYDNQQVPNSPFGVLVSPKSNAKLVVVSGRGIQGNGIRVGDKAEININTENSGNGVLSVKLIRPDKSEESIKINELKPNFYHCLYVPAKPGQYEIKIDYDDTPVSKSPFQINVLPKIESKISAYGPGLKEGVCDKPVLFITDTNGEIGGLGFSIEGPSKAKIESCDNHDGSATICYWPTIPGEYAIRVLCDEKDIPNSPFMANIFPSTDKINISKIKVYGPGVQKDANVGVPNEFTIDFADIKSDIKPDVQCYHNNGDELPVSIKPIDGNKYQCSYNPVKPGNYKIFANCEKQSLPKSPFKVKVAEPSISANVKVSGQGIKSTTRYSPSHFTVDTSKAGSGTLALELVDELGNTLPLQVTNKPGSDIFEVQYQPKTAGPVYNCTIRYDGTEIPGSPFQIQIKPELDISKVFVDKLETVIFQESFVRFLVNAKAIDKKGDGTVKAIFTDPKGFKTGSSVKNCGDGTYICTYSPKENGKMEFKPTFFDIPLGLYNLDVSYNDLPIKINSPQIKVVPGNDPSRVKVYGDGLKGGYTNQNNNFTIDLVGAGKGDLGLVIEGPSDANIKGTTNSDGTCTVEYSSNFPGIYDVYIKFNDIDIPNCPFKLPIQDPINVSNVHCLGESLKPGHVNRAEEPITFTVDASRAGEAPVKAICKDGKGHNFPVELKPKKNAASGIYDVNFVPTTPGPYSLEIKHGDVTLPGAPFHFNVLPKTEPERVKVNGDGINPIDGHLLPSVPAEFRIDVSEAGKGELQLSITNPEGISLPIDIIEEGKGIVCCKYVPTDAGEHSILTLFEGVPVGKSPFKVNVASCGDASKCAVQGSIKDYMPVNTEMVITVNTADAGNGKISCKVLPVTESGVVKSNEPLKVEVEDNGNGTQSLYFTPLELGNYSMDIRYGGVSIPNGKFITKAVDPENLPEEVIEKDTLSAQYTSFGEDHQNYSNFMYPVEFKLPIAHVGGIIEATILTPSGKKESVVAHDNKDGTVTIKYEPHERGMHEMTVTCDKIPIQGSPYKFFAENVDSGKVAAFGSGLTHGKTGSPAEFTIVTKDAGAGGLSMAIEGPSKAEIHCKDNANGSCDVEYHPMTPGEYNISIKFGDQHIPGSPFVAKILDEENDLRNKSEPQRRSQLSIGSTSDVPLKLQNLDISTLTASVKSPSGKEESCVLKKMANENLGISFTPREVGDYLINVYQSGDHVIGSPFKITVGQNEIGDSSKVNVSGDGLKQGISREANFFTVDTRKAGYGGLSLSIEGPGKAEIECKDNYDGTCQISYIPTDPGTYMVNVKYADEHVPGSPFAVKVTGDPSTRLMEKIICRQEAADITQVGSECELSLKVPETNPHDMKASVTNPFGKTEMCEILDLDDGHYSIKFIPKEMGLHSVAVLHKDAHIPGSPFKFTVGPIVDGGAHKVVANGNGLNSGYTNEVNEFNIYTREAGAGGLSIAVEGPSKAEINFEDCKDGSCSVKYYVSEPGEYLASIKFNDDHIVNSPFRIKVNEKPSECISIASLGSSSSNKELIIGRPAAFTVNYLQAGDVPASEVKLKAMIVGPSKIEEPAIVQKIGNAQYAIRFIPKECGQHLFSVLDEQTNQHIPGSPFVVIIDNQLADPGMVHARGDGLTKGFVGKKNMFIVNTIHSGTGALNVTIDGPSKVQLYSQEHEEGYEFIYVPTVPGEYQITIKYGGNYHIAGSPFTANITGSAISASKVIVHQQSNLKVETVKKSNAAILPKQMTSFAHKVQCHGMGIKKAHLDQVNTFNIDASQAGNNILLVGIAGPKSQCQEISVKHLGRNQFVINYMVEEKGRHYLMVKWGDKNIPGSPFVIDVM